MALTVQTTKDATEIVSAEAINKVMSTSRTRLMILYFIATALLFSDQNVLAPNLTAIAEEFDLSDIERDKMLGGRLSLAFFLCGAPASICVGYVIDNYVAIRRSVVFAIVMFIGEGACLGTYFVGNFNELLICRTFTGFSAGGAIPIVYSILGDIYAPHERARVSAVIACAVGVGVCFGQGVAGYLGSHFGWRLSFVVIAVPALICAFLMLFVCDPPRGMMETNSHYEEVRRQDNDIAVRTRNKIDVEKIIDSENVAKSIPEQNDTSRAVIWTGTEPSTILPSSRRKESFSERKQRSENGRMRLLSDFDEDTDLSTMNTTMSSALSDDLSSPDLQNRDSDSDYNERNINESLSHDDSIETEHFLKPHSVKCLLAQGSTGCLPWGVVNTYLSDYLSEDRGMSVDDATSTMLLCGFGLFLGVLFGGLGGEYAYKKDVRLPIVFGGFCNIIGCFPMYYLINHVSESSSILLIGGMSISTGIFLGALSPNVKSTLTNVSLPTNRGKTFSSLNIFDELGRGFGPMLVSIVISKFGRRRAFNMSLLGWIISGLLNICSSCFVKEDESRVQRHSLQRRKNGSHSIPPMV